MDPERVKIFLDEEEKKAIQIQLKTLDDILAVNGLFTVAIFVGLSLESQNQRSLEGSVKCDADPGIAQRLVLYEVVSFAFFLLSSLSAKTCKVILDARLTLEKEFELVRHSRGITLAVSAFGSFAGVVFLTLSMVNVVQVKIGKLSCGSNYAIQSVVYMCAIVLVAFLIYGPHMICAVWYGISKEKFTKSHKALNREIDELIKKIQELKKKRNLGGNRYGEGHQNKEGEKKNKKKDGKKEDQNNEGEDVISAIV